MVRPNLGYKSASPAAIRQNFREDPAFLLFEIEYFSIYFFVSGLIWDFDATTVRALGSGTETWSGLFKIFPVLPAGSIIS